MKRNQNKYLIVILLALSVLGSGLFFAQIANAGTLSCSVTTAAACTSPSVVILRMSGSGNAHAELPSQSTAAYANNVVCCGGETNLSNSCSGSYTTVLKLSGTSNAHVQQSGSYSQSACISIPSGTAPTVAYVAGDQSCTPTYDDTLLSMSAASNAHVGNETAYNAAGNYKICATAAAGFSTAIEIRAQNYTTSVSTITFPQGAPGATVSNPSNSAGNTQTFGGAGTAKPVVTLYNGSAGTLKIWYNITTFTNGIVSSENYLVNNKGAACADASCITNAVTFDTNTDTGTTITAGAGNEKDFYLKIVLSAVAGKTGNSTLTILGEAL